jgi:hypothetical protein
MFARSTETSGCILHPVVDLAGSPAQPLAIGDACQRQLLGVGKVPHYLSIEKA